jgi:transposase
MNEPIEISSIRVRDIDHLGIVAGICDDMGLVEKLDHLLGTHPQEHLSCGQAVKAMILNGLGFLSAPLYLFEEFFLGKPTEHLIGSGVEPQHLNDDRLGRVLDRLFDADLTEVFVQVALAAADRFGVGMGSVHLDATSFHLHGKKYDEPDEKGGGGGGGGGGERAIRITHGYSRDHRPDLKQFVVDLMTSKDGGVPLFFRVADGNEADQAVFAELLRAFEAQIDLDALFVADSALYGAQSLDALRGLRWLCRVPLTVKEAKEAVSGIAEEEFVAPSDPALAGYKIHETLSDYGEVSQRWLVVQSDQLRAAALSKLEEKLRRLEEDLGKKLKKLKRKKFGCEADAKKAAAEFAGGLAYHRLTDLGIVGVNSPGKAGRPGASFKEGEPSDPPPLSYRLEARLLKDEAKVALARRAAGRFVLATSVLDEEKLESEAMLVEYKGKDRVERGFRFLKDPLFFASSVFVKSAKRVGAIAMVMSLCLLVYGLGERREEFAGSIGRGERWCAPSEWEEDPEADAAVDLADVSGGTRVGGGRSEADHEPHRGAKEHLGIPGPKL